MENIYPPKQKIVLNPQSDKPNKHVLSFLVGYSAALKMSKSRSIHSVDYLLN